MTNDPLYTNPRICYDPSQKELEPMPMNEKATNAVFKGLTCPFTGKPITVRVIAHGKGVPMYFSPDAMDLTLPQANPAKLLERAGTRNGIMGALTNGNELKCPYTGARMTIEKMPDGSGYRMVGGFCPSTPMTDPNLFARALMTRDGVAPEGAPEAKVAVTFPEDLPPAPSARDPKPKDFAMDYCDRVISAALPPKVAVTVPDAPKTKRKK